jgi:hypothetical protein
VREPSEETGGHDGRTRSVALAAVSLLGLLVVVALASRAHHESGGGGSGGGPSRAFYDYVATTAFLLFGLGACFVVWVFVVSGGTRRRGPRKGNTLTILAAVTVISLVFAIAMRFHGFIGSIFSNRRASPPSLPSIDPGKANAALAARRHLQDPQFRWIPLAILGLLALGALAMIAFRLLRQKDELLREVGIAEALATVVDDALDDLRAERDARRAIIAAYARMETLCGAHGVPRHAAEAPFEYVGRVLSLLSVATLPTMRLTGLFERAKFSKHDLGPDARDSAIDALEQVRDGLRSPA